MILDVAHVTPEIAHVLPNATHVTPYVEHVTDVTLDFAQERHVTSHI